MRGPGKTPCLHTPRRRLSDCHSVPHDPMQRCAEPRSHAPAAAAGTGPSQLPRRARWRRPRCQQARRRERSRCGALCLRSAPLDVRDRRSHPTVTAAPPGSRHGRTTPRPKLLWMMEESADAVDGYTDPSAHDATAGLCSLCRLLLRLQRSCQLPNGRVIEDHRAGERARAHRTLQLVAQLHSTERVDPSLHQRHIGVDGSSCR
eukprot:3971487-Prymnesium_polylepis.1